MYHCTNQQKHRNSAQLTNDKSTDDHDKNDNEENNGTNDCSAENGVVNIQVQCLASENNQKDRKQILHAAQMANKDSSLVINENDKRILDVFCQNQHSNHSLIEPPKAFQDYHWLTGFDANKNGKDIENVLNFYSHNENKVVDVAYNQQSPSPSFIYDDNNSYEEFTLSPTESIVNWNNKHQFQKTNDQKIKATNMGNNFISNCSPVNANQYQLYHRLLQNQNSPLISTLKQSVDQNDISVACNNPPLLLYAPPGPPPSSPLVISKTETNYASATACSTSYSPPTPVCYDSSSTPVPYHHLRQYSFSPPSHRFHLFQQQPQPLQRNDSFHSLNYGLQIDSSLNNTSRSKTSPIHSQLNHHYHYQNQFLNSGNHFNSCYQNNYPRVDLSYPISPLLSTSSTPLPSTSLSATIPNSTILRKPHCSVVNIPGSCNGIMENNLIDSSIPVPNNLQSYNRQVIINNNKSNFIKGNLMAENKEELFKTNSQPEMVDASMKTAKSSIETKTTAIKMMAMVEEQAKQEAQLRELKGYEASAKYQPPLIDTGTVAAALLTQSGTIIPDIQSHKRSCSQWRMTLFVFYWIIWIVFLIGVVIIVAANTRTE